MKEKLLKLFTVDAFSDGPFSGNPAAVVLLDQDYDEHFYQKMAVEMNLSETAFVRPVNGSFAVASEFILRWFTPTSEVALCGHATLANSPGHFLCSRRKDNNMIGMDFPQYHPKPLIPEHFQHLFIHNSRTLETWLQDLIDEVSYVCQLNRFTYAQIRENFWLFWTKNIPGSAHCALGPYWSAVLKKTELLARQCSKRGANFVLSILPGDRIEITGKGSVVLDGYVNLSS